ncbi:MAG: glucose-6-phosphate dehydrogenase [Vicinamibacterales bacterium]
MSSADPCILVIFGASGDLTRRKLLPALVNLAKSDLLPDPFAVVGIARPPLSEDKFRTQMEERVRDAEGSSLDPARWRRIAERLHYISGEFDDAQLYVRLRELLEALDERYRTPGHYLFYLAVPPTLFGTVALHLASADLTAERGRRWRRVIVEKPFGHDLDSARALNAELSSGLDETQIYRIDHYLGKETVQNLLAFRFANGIFEPVWNRRYVDHVQMTVAEEVGIEGRGAYYDEAGALRDIVQNHMFQLLTLVAMEPPISFRAENLRDEKVKVLHAVPPFSPDDVRRKVVRGQYAGYRQEKHVAPDSTTDTFVAMRLCVDNWRWAGVPFYLRTGKRMPKRLTEIAVQFKQPPFIIFRGTAIDHLNPNVLIIRIQPNEGISLAFDAKVPGPLDKLGTVTMDFSYSDYFGGAPSTGYETLLYDAMIGDQTLFHRMDIVEAGWQVVAPALETWSHDGPRGLTFYEPGTAGPREAEALVARDGRQWRC